MVGLDHRSDPVDHGETSAQLLLLLYDFRSNAAHRLCVCVCVYAYTWIPIHRYSLNCCAFLISHCLCDYHNSRRQTNVQPNSYSLLYERKTKANTEEDQVGYLAFPRLSSFLPLFFYPSVVTFNGIVVKKLLHVVASAIACPVLVYDVAIVVGVAIIVLNGHERKYIKYHILKRFLL